MRTEEPIRLNIGGGDVPLPGFLTIDRKTGWEAFPLRRSHERGPSTFADNSVDEIRASHVLEHFPGHKAEEVLREWVRVLKPGGILRVAVPDLDKLFDAVSSGNPDNWPIQGYLYGGQTDDDDYHRSGYNDGWLRHLMVKVGLHDIQPWTSDIEDCAALPVSLNLQGTKGGDAVLLAKPFPSHRKIQAVISLPRYGPTKYFNALVQTLGAFRIPVEMQWGAWWDHRLTAAIENALDAGVEWVLTLDYDSPPRPEDVKALAVLMEEHPEIDALAPIQVKREEDTALFRPIDPATGQYKAGKITLAEFDGDVTEVGWAHFGLTLIRASALRKMKKPWFLGVPDAKGGWSDHSTHPDIYFWNNLRESGGRLFVANHVSIPHMQDIAVWPRHDMGGAVFQYMSDMQRDGKPRGGAQMKIRMLRSGWRRGRKPGDIIDMGENDGLANQLIRSGRAEPADDTDPSEVRQAHARNALIAKQAEKGITDETPVPEIPRQQPTGRHGGSAGKPRKQAAVAGDR
jgi:hypothetical protein